MRRSGGPWAALTGASAFQAAALEESMALNHTAPPPDERRPPHLRDGDPFASKLSWEADLVAGFYLTIIGKFPCFFSRTKAAPRKIIGCYVDFAQRCQLLREYFEMRSGRKQEKRVASGLCLFHRSDFSIFIIRDKYSPDNPRSFTAK